MSNIEQGFNVMIGGISWLLGFLLPLIIVVLIFIFLLLLTWFLFDYLPNRKRDY